MSGIPTSTRKILIIPIHQLKHTPYNPAARTKEGARLHRLTNSIKLDGLVYPILVTEALDVVDGNRRLTACRMAGFVDIECIMTTQDRDQLFKIVNTTAVPIGGKGWLEIAKGGGLLPDKEASQYKELHGLIGSYGIDILIRHDLGLNILALSKSIVHLGIKKRVEEIILVTAQFKLTNKLNMELRADKSQDRKIAAINKILRDAKAKS